MKEQLLIFDTTLRDGEQSPGASMTKDEKIRIALQLERMNVDIIEAGFPAASNGDFNSVKAVANIIKKSTVCGLARAFEKDIKLAFDAIKHADKSRIHTFIATSPIHMKNKLRMDPSDVLDQAVSAVKYAKSFCDDIEFSPEDAGRSNVDFLCKMLEKVIAAGANTINIPDTVGYTMPEQFSDLVKSLINKIPNSDKVVWSVHCHNDLGFAVANSLASVLVGARQIECTVNGLGERAGNASLEEIVMAIKTRKDYYPCFTNIDTTQIVPASKLVSTITGFPVQPNKAIVGANAFAHESGIHQDGVLKDRETYEIMLAQDVGWTDNQLVLGKHSGRNALRSRLSDLGYEFDSESRFNEIFSKFKSLADKKHEIFDDDLILLLSNDDALSEEELYKFISMKIKTEYGKKPTANIVILKSGKKMEATETGSGPVDAVFKALETLIQSGSRLELYTVNAITSGTDSLGEVGVRLSKDTRIVNGQGADLDILVASAKAYLNAINRILGDSPKLNPQLSLN